jgi:malate dehydrogenase
VKHSPETILVVVSNPLDVMAYVAMKVSGFAKQRVVGMAGILDTARFRAFIAMELGVSVEDIQTLVLGGHGDSMVPVVSCTSVGGVPLVELLRKDRIDALVDRTRKGGTEIVNLLKTGSAYYAPSAAAIQMAEAILKDKRRVLPCAAYLEGEFGLKGMFIGVPVILGANGVEKIVEVELSGEEKAALEKSAVLVKEQIEKLSL